MSRAREQESFIVHVSQLLDKTSWAYTVRMNSRFEVTFGMDLGLIKFEHQIRAVWQALAAVYCVQRLGDALEIASIRRDGYSCRVVFGEAP